jgi:preprotein translocase subunit YajC
MSASFVSTIFPFILMLGLFYLIIFVPENRRKKKYSSMLNSLKVNDEVITKGGIIGKIVNIQDDFVIVQTGPDKARIKLNKNGISNVLNTVAEEPKTEEKKES